MATILDREFMEHALRHAKTALQNDWIPVGCVLVEKGRIISHGIKTGQHHARLDHAELNAINQALWSREGPRTLSGVTVYVTLEPCMVCMSMLMACRVARVVYGLKDHYAGAASFLTKASSLPPMYQKVKTRIEGGCLASESVALLREFFVHNEKGKTWDRDNPLVKHCIESS